MLFRTAAFLVSPFFAVHTRGLSRHCRPRQSLTARQIAIRMMQAPPAPVKNLPFVNADIAAKIDNYLMGPEIGYTLDQLMELAGQAVALGCHMMYPAGSIAICCGPGNNGGDGLVAARWLRSLSREVSVVLPSPSQGKFPHLETLCRVHDVPVLHTSTVPENTDIIVDAIFGFSFKPRGERGVDGELLQVIESINSQASTTPVVSVDCPSGWHVDRGDIYEISVKSPSCVISLTAPKLCMKEAHEKQKMAHLIGGRFIPAQVWKKFELQPVVYTAMDLVVRVA